MVSIIIVSYNAKTLLKKCIDSLKNNIHISYEIIVVDNNSEAETVEYLKSIESFCKVIFNRENVGFSKANNIGFMYAEGKVIHFLNPDTVVDESINILYEKVLNSPVGKVYSTSLMENGKKIHGGHILPVFKNIYYLLTHKRLAKWYIGASLLFHREDFQSVGRWNENYFMYSEDLDLCYQVYKHNLIIEEIESNIIHLGGGTTTWNKSQKDLRKEKAYIRFFLINNMIINYFAFSFSAIIWNCMVHHEVNFVDRMALMARALYETCKEKYNK